MYSTLISQRMGSKNLIIILMEANVCNEIRIKCFLLMSDVAKMLKYLLPKKWILRENIMKETTFEHWNLGVVLKKRSHQKSPILPY